MFRRFDIRLKDYVPSFDLKKLPKPMLILEANETHYICTKITRKIQFYTPEPMFLVF